MVRDLSEVSGRLFYLQAQPGCSLGVDAVWTRVEDGLRRGAVPGRPGQVSPETGSNLGQARRLCASFPKRELGPGPVLGRLYLQEAAVRRTLDSNFT